jgi:hypothetical protein
MLTILVCASTLTAGCLSPATLTLQEAGVGVSGRLAAHKVHESMRADTPHGERTWRFMGPSNISGRVVDVAVPTPRGEHYTLYVATATGGLWRSRNEGTTFEPLFEDGPTGSIGALAVDPADSERLWMGTGEANIFRSSMAGTGIYLSEDGGTTFTHKGLEDTHTIARICVHPTDPNTVYVAASGHEWTDNPERGVYRTRDGGASWQRVLFVDEGTGAIDLALDPQDPSRLYAATWERKRLRWNDPRTYPATRGSGVWRSEDGGDSWQPINEGLPLPEHRGRIGLATTPSLPGSLYAFVDNYELVELEQDEERGEQDEQDEQEDQMRAMGYGGDGEDEEGGQDEQDEEGEQEASDTDSYGREKQREIKGATLYRSLDHGSTWQRASEENRFMRGLSATYGWVFGQVRADPGDADRVYVMGLALNVSEDGGKTFRSLRGMHGDHHALWIDPDNSDYLVNGNDGGLAISYDGGENWRTSTNTLPAVQFYNLAVDMAEPFHMYGSIQDHGSRVGTASSGQRRRSRGGGSAREWESASGGEASFHAVDPTDSNVLYSEGFYGSIQRTDLESGERLRLQPKAAEGEPELRGQWLAPFLLSPHNPRVVYHGMNRLYRSMHMGDGFEPISPDLTSNDPEQLGDISFQTITAISESPFTFGELYVGTDDGHLRVTLDSGAHWEERSAGLAQKRWISRVVASAHQEGVVYAAQNGKRWDDFGTYLWRSPDRGLTWQNIGAGIPCGPINVVHEDPKVSGLLYVGTDLGVYVSLDDGQTWDVLGGGLPNTFVHDLVVHPRNAVLLAATHGRGVWQLDVRTLQEGEEPADPVLEQATDEEAAESSEQAGEED